MVHSLAGRPRRARYGALIVAWLFLWINPAEAQLFGPYKWKDSKGTCVAAMRGTIEGQAPVRVKLPLSTIKDLILGLSGAGLDSFGDREYIARELSEAEQEAFFAAIQKALADTGKAEYSFNFPASLVKYIGIKRGFEDTILELNGPFEGFRCKPGK